MCSRPDGRQAQSTSSTHACRQNAGLNGFWCSHSLQGLEVPRSLSHSPAYTLRTQKSGLVPILLVDWQTRCGVCQWPLCGGCCCARRSSVRRILIGGQCKAPFYLPAAAHVLAGIHMPLAPGRPVEASQPESCCSCWHCVTQPIELFNCKGCERVSKLARMSCVDTVSNAQPQSGRSIPREGDHFAAAWSCTAI